MELRNPIINAEIAARLDEENLDPSQRAKLEHEFAQEVHLLTVEKRLRVVAQDFVRHYSDLWTSGKAMMMSFNKVTCVRMYNYVQKSIRDILGQELPENYSEDSAFYYSNTIYNYVSRNLTTLTPYFHYVFPERSLFRQRLSVIKFYKRRLFPKYQ